MYARAVKKVLNHQIAFKSNPPVSPSFTPLFLSVYVCLLLCVLTYFTGVGSSWDLYPLLDTPESIKHLQIIWQSDVCYLRWVLTFRLHLSVV